MVFHQKKKGNLTQAEQQHSIADAQCADKQGDRWTFVAVLPDTGFIHTVHHGKRTSEQAGKFLAKIKQKSNGKAPLFISDAWFYENVLYETYCHYQPRPYCGRGRPPGPQRIVDKELKYAQVYKKKTARVDCLKWSQELSEVINRKLWQSSQKTVVLKPLILHL